METCVFNPVASSTMRPTPDKLSSEKLESGSHLDQHIEVAVLTRIATCARAEDRELRHAFGLDRRGVLAQLGNDLVAGHE